MEEEANAPLETGSSAAEAAEQVGFQPTRFGPSQLKNIGGDSMGIDLRSPQFTFLILAVLYVLLMGHYCRRIELNATSLNRGVLLVFLWMMIRWIDRKDRMVGWTVSVTLMVTMLVALCRRVSYVNDPSTKRLLEMVEDHQKLMVQIPLEDE